MNINQDEAERGFWKHCPSGEVYVVATTLDDFDQLHVVAASRDLAASEITHDNLDTITVYPYPSLIAWFSDPLNSFLHLTYTEVQEIMNQCQEEKE